jgi:hypothetical protein
MMGQHRKAKTRRTASARATHTKVDNSPRAAPATEGCDYGRDDGQPVRRVNVRALEDLADAARAARQRGWSFSAELLATADTHRVPAAPSADALPRRYATHQPTAPLPRAPQRADTNTAAPRNVNPRA